MWRFGNNNAEREKRTLAWEAFSWLAGGTYPRRWLACLLTCFAYLFSTPPWLVIPTVCLFGNDMVISGVGGEVKDWVAWLFNPRID